MSGDASKIEYAEAVQSEELVALDLFYSIWTCQATLFRECRLARRRNHGGSGPKTAGWHRLT